MPTTVVNRRTSAYDVYIGRPGSYGNPFRIGPDGDRDLVLLTYFKWFYAEAQRAFRQQVKVELTGKALGCWCKPLRCHGDILAAYCDARTVNDCPVCGARWEDVDPVAGIIHRTRLCKICYQAYQAEQAEI